MPGCPHLDTCRLDLAVPDREARRVWRSFYCEGTYDRCERYKLGSGGAIIPDNLLPSGRLIEVSEPAVLPTGTVGRR